MPIRPENIARYPADWPQISKAIREDRAGGRCECEGECGRGTHQGRCPNINGQPAYGTGSKVVLTVAHLDHTPENVDPADLRAYCQGCHLHYDRDHHARTRQATRAAALAAQMEPLFTPETTGAGDRTPAPVADPVPGVPAPGAGRGEREAAVPVSPPHPGTPRLPVRGVPDQASQPSQPPGPRRRTRRRSTIHFDRGGEPRCGTPGSTALTGDPGAVTCVKCAGILAGTWATGWSRAGRVWADHKPHGTPAAVRRHYRRGEKPLRLYCEPCDERAKRDTKDRYWTGKAEAGQPVRPPGHVYRRDQRNRRDGYERGRGDPWPGSGSPGPAATARSGCASASRSAAAGPACQPEHALASAGSARPRAPAGESGEDVITVHCIFCPHVERAFDPYAAHDQMEAHYAGKHATRIAALTGLR